MSALAQSALAVAFMVINLASPSSLIDWICLSAVWGVGIWAGTSMEQECREAEMRKWAERELPHMKEGK